MKVAHTGLFIDLDGTLIQTISGLTFPLDTNDWQFTPGVVGKLYLKMLSGYSIHIVSNQGGIAAGFHTQEQITEKFKVIAEQLAVKLVGNSPRRPLITFQFCPVMDADDPARKPNIGMLTYIRDTHNVDLRQSLMVGDMDSDKECAANAGCAYQDISAFLS